MTEKHEDSQNTNVDIDTLQIQDHSNTSRQARESMLLKECSSVRNPKLLPRSVGYFPDSEDRLSWISLCVVANVPCGMHFWRMGRYILWDCSAARGCHLCMLLRRPQLTSSLDCTKARAKACVESNARAPIGSSCLTCSHSGRCLGLCISACW